MLTVVKVGGALVRAADELSALVRGIAALEGRVVVVHGGGADITEWQQRLGLPVEWRDGLRVTSPEAARVTAMVLSGWTNKRLVSALLDAGESAVGLSGEDGLMSAERIAGGALGDVGTVARVHPTPILALLAAGLIPVVSPVSRGPEGLPLNVNADDAAVALAVALGADRLWLCSDVPGVLRDGTVVEEVDPEGAEALLASGVASGGMAVKVRQALTASRGGVETRIGGLDLLASGAVGTRFRTAAAPAAAVAGAA